MTLVMLSCLKFGLFLIVIEKKGKELVRPIIRPYSNKDGISEDKSENYDSLAFMPESKRRNKIKRLQKQDDSKIDECDNVNFFENDSNEHSESSRDNASQFQAPEITVSREINDEFSDDKNVEFSGAIMSKIAGHKWVDSSLLLNALWSTEETS